MIKLINKYHKYHKTYKNYLIHEHIYRKYVKNKPVSQHFISMQLIGGASTT